MIVLSNPHTLVMMFMGLCKRTSSYHGHDFLCVVEEVQNVHIDPSFVSHLLFVNNIVS